MYCSVSSQLMDTVSPTLVTSPDAYRNTNTSEAQAGM